MFSENKKASGDRAHGRLFSQSVLSLCFCYNEIEVVQKRRNSRRERERERERERDRERETERETEREKDRERESARASGKQTKAQIHLKYTF